MSKYKLTIYLKSGQTIVVNCDEYEFSYYNKSLEFSAYDIKHPAPLFSLVPSQIAAYTAEEVKCN